MFAFELASVDKSTIDANKWGFFSDFDRDADCVRNNGNPADRDCCWNGMSPFILYNTNTKQCCPDGKPVGFGKSCGDKDWIYIAIFIINMPVFFHKIPMNFNFKTYSSSSTQICYLLCVYLSLNYIYHLINTIEIQKRMMTIRTTTNRVKPPLRKIKSRPTCPPCTENRPILSRQF